MAGVSKEFAHGSPFYDTAGVHHDDRITALGNDAEVVGDEDGRSIHFLTEFLEEVQDLSLDRDIESGGGFVSNDEIRVTGEGNGNDDTLAHTAGELVRELIDTRFRGRDADLFKEFDGSDASFREAEATVKHERLADLFADGMDRVEGGHGLLENDADVLTTDRVHFIAREGHQVTALKHDFARDNLTHGLGEESNDGHGSDAFATAGFADDAHAGAARDIETDPVNSSQKTGLRFKSSA
jgi:hypothetical protein